MNNIYELNSDNFKDYKIISTEDNIKSIENELFRFI